MDLKKKIKNHIFTNNHVTLIDLIPLQYMCKERLSPTEVTPVFSQYALKFLLITFFSEYLKMMFFLIPDNPAPSTEAEFGKEWRSEEQTGSPHSSDKNVSLYAKCSYYVILLIFFLISLQSLNKY